MRTEDVHLVPECCKIRGVVISCMRFCDIALKVQYVCGVSAHRAGLSSAGVLYLHGVDMLLAFFVWWVVRKHRMYTSVAGGRVSTAEWT